jgi:hypothetical protein
VDVERPLDFLEFAGLDQASCAGNDGIEEEQQFQGDVLIKVQSPIAGAVTITGIIMETIQQRQQFPEVFEALELIRCDWLASGHCHGEDDATKAARAQVKIALILHYDVFMFICNRRAEQDWVKAYSVEKKTGRDTKL